MAIAEKKLFKFPKLIGTCADKLYNLRQKRLTDKKLVDAIESEEKALKEHIINILPKSQASGVSGKVARVTITPKEIAQVEDWDKFLAYVHKKKAYYLMQRRLNDAAVKELWEDGKKIPGVIKFTYKTVSLNKL